MILLLSIVINLLFLYSIVDKNFRSLQIVPRVDCNISTIPISKRVVLFISDGLSANQLYRETAKMGKASYIRSVMEGGGSWGVSVADVPTMTVTRIVTIYTGTLHTNMNILFLGNYRFPVDNVFNYPKVYYVGDTSSFHSFDDTVKNWTTITWGEEFPSKVKTDYIQYDEFVCENIEKLVQHKSFGNNTAFILYLPAVDYCGHDFLPASQACTKIVKHLDSCIRKTVNLFEKIGETTFLLTSDHGMADNGLHGYADASMRETPIVVWGHGIAKNAGHFYVRPSIWNATGMKNVHILQSDIASLISVLMGNAIPANSHGLLPVELFQDQNANLVKALYCQIVQLHNIAKHQHIMTTYIDNLEQNMQYLKSQLNEESGSNITEAIRKERTILKEIEKELRWYRVCFVGDISILVNFIYAGWTAWLFLRVLHSIYPNTQNNKTFLIMHYVFDSLFFLSILSIYFIVKFKKWPIHFSIYLSALYFVWWRALRNVACFKIDYKLVPILGYVLLLIFVAMSIHIVEVRYIFLSFMTVLLAFLSRKTIGPRLFFLWIVTLLALVQFLNADIFYTPISTTAITISAVGLVMTAVAYMGLAEDPIWPVGYLIIVILAHWNILTVIKRKTFWHTVLSFAILFLGFSVGLLSPGAGFKKLCRICFGFGAVFMLMTVRMEGAGLQTCIIFMFIWYAIELKKSGKDIMAEFIESKTNLNLDDLRRGLMLVHFSWILYFASGFSNYPTSYDIKWSHSFFEWFDTDQVACIILIKEFIPVFLLAAIITAMNHALGVDKYKFLEWYLFLNNILAVYFFNRSTVDLEYRNHVKNGFDLANHILSNAFPILIVIFAAIADFFLTDKLNITLRKITHRIPIKNIFS